MFRSLTANGSTTQACAACKYQRRKCSAECPLAPFFPPDLPKQFLNVHRLFGVGNILRILKQLDASQKTDAMKSIVYEAEAREKDPVYGCFGIITMLQTQVERLREELDLIRTQIFCFQQQQQQQQQSQPLAMGGHVSNALSLNPWNSPYYMNSVHIGLEGQGLNQDYCYDIKPLEYDQDSEDRYESSAESTLKEAGSLEHLLVHDLKSAAALFTLTNKH